jgi:hypothetical protein
MVTVLANCDDACTVWFPNSACTGSPSPGSTEAVQGQYRGSTGAVQRRYRGSTEQATHTSSRDPKHAQHEVSVDAMEA